MPLDLDEQIRRAADGPLPRLDVESLIRTGRRRRHRFQAGGVAVVAAAVTVVAVVISPGGRSPVVVPIEPMPMPSETASAPETGDDIEAEPLPVLWWDEALGGGGVAPHGRWAVANEDILVAVAGIIGEDPTVIAGHDLESGEQRWSTRIESGWPAMPQLIADGLVLVSTQYEELFALDVATGEVRWRVEFDSGYGVTTAATTADSAILVADSHSEGDFRPPIVRHVSLADGSTLWETALRDGEGVQWSPPLVIDGQVLVATVPGGDQRHAAVHSLSLTDGSAAWARDVGPSQANGKYNFTPMQFSPGLVHVPVPDAGIVTLRLEGGEIAWQLPKGQLVAGMAESVAALDDGRLVSLDPKTGTYRATGPLLHPGRATSIDSDDDQRVLIPLEENALAVVDPHTATVLRQLELPALALGILQRDEVLAVATESRGVLVGRLPDAEGTDSDG